VQIEPSNFLKISEWVAKSAEFVADFESIKNVAQKKKTKSDRK
jgi:hypothetical protein